MALKILRMKEEREKQRLKDEADQKLLKKSYDEMAKKYSRAERREIGIWALINEVSQMRKFIHNDHPFIRYKPLDISESITMRVGFIDGLVEGNPHVTGSIAYTNLRQDHGSGLSFEPSRFKMGLSSLIRSLLFYETNYDNYEAFENIDILNDDGTLDIEQTVEYVRLLTDKLPIHPVAVKRTMNASDGEEYIKTNIDFECDVEGIYVPSLGIPTSIDAEHLEKTQNKDEADMIVKKNIQFVLSRLFLQIMTEEQFEDYLNQSRENTVPAEESKYLSNLLDLKLK